MKFLTSTLYEFLLFSLDCIPGAFADSYYRPSIGSDSYTNYFPFPYSEMLEELFNEIL